MKRIKFAKTWLGLLLIFFLVYNTYFGWNRLAESYAEEVCDFIWEYGVLWGLVIYFLPAFDIYERWVEEKQKEKE